MRIFLGLLLVALGLGACDCGGPGSRSLDKAEDAGVVSSSSMSAMSSSSSGSSTQGSSAGSQASSGVSSSQGVSSSGPPPVEEPSRQRLTLTVQNVGSLDVFLVTGGWYCTALAFQQQPPNTITWMHVPTALGFQCGCECPNPGPPQATQYLRLAPGTSHIVQWDARRLVTYVEQRDCSMGPSMHTARVVHGVLQPVTPGRFRVQMEVSQAVPQHCTTVDNTTWTCPVMPGGLTTFPDTQTLCGAGVTLETIFDLPAIGDPAASLLIHNLGG